MMTVNICLDCNDNSFLECMECDLNFSSDCNCYVGGELADATFFCHKCFNVLVIPARDLTDDIEDLDSYEDSLDDLIILRSGDVSWDAFPNDENWGKVSYWKDQCQHSQTCFTLPSGTEVFCSSVMAPLGRKPDFALYLDHEWRSPGFAYYIEWKDFDTPEEAALDDAVLIVADVYKKARKGLFVEVGCIGGHGRTGTVLAIMCVLEGLDTTEAISYVRSNYCKRAIESSSQEWMVDYAHCFVNGGETKVRPVSNLVFTFERAFDWENWDINNVDDATIDLKEEM